MLDTKTKTILKILAKECGKGGYKIIELSDIRTALPKHLHMENAAIKHILTYLEREDMISIKYAEETLFCIAILPLGIQTIEALSNTPAPQHRTTTLTSLLFPFLASFLGAFLALLLTHLLFL